MQGGRAQGDHLASGALESGSYPSQLDKYSNGPRFSKKKLGQEGRSNTWPAGFDRLRAGAMASFITCAVEPANDESAPTECVLYVAARASSGGSGSLIVTGFCYVQETASGVGKTPT